MRLPLYRTSSSPLSSLETSSRPRALSLSVPPQAWPTSRVASSALPLPPPPPPPPQLPPPPLPQLPQLPPLQPPQQRRSAPVAMRRPISARIPMPTSRRCAAALLNWAQRTTLTWEDEEEEDVFVWGAGERGEDSWSWTFRSARMESRSTRSRRHTRSSRPPSCTCVRERTAGERWENAGRTPREGRENAEGGVGVLGRGWVRWDAAGWAHGPCGPGPQLSSCRPGPRPRVLRSWPSALALSPTLGPLPHPRPILSPRPLTSRVQRCRGGRRGAGQDAAAGRDPRVRPVHATAARGGPQQRVSPVR